MLRTAALVAGAPRLGRTSSVVAPGLARRSADVPLQQLLDAQRVPTAPRARRASVGGLVPTVPGAEGEMVPCNPRARRMSTMIASQRVLPTEASTALSLMAQTIPEEGESQKDMPWTFILSCVSLRIALQQAVPISLAQHISHTQM